MSQRERTCTRCGTAVALGAARCPVCGAHPDVGPLVVRRELAPTLPMRQLARPVALGASVLAAGAALRLARDLLPRLRRQRAQPPAPLAPKAPPARSRVVAIQRRIWAVGDRTGTHHWGAEEITWHVPDEG